MSSRFRGKEYAHLTDKVGRMIKSKMWATPKWYEAARIAPPPINLRYPPVPTLDLPEIKLEKKLMQRIPLLKLEQEHKGKNPSTETSLAWKFCQRQYMYMHKLKMDEDKAFELTEQDLDPEIAAFIKKLETTPPEYRSERGPHLSEADLMDKMNPTSRLSVFAIKDNLAAQKRAEALTERARKRKQGLKPKSSVTDMLEEQLNPAKVVDPLYGASVSTEFRKRFLLKQIEELGVESVQRRFINKPSETKRFIQDRLSDGAQRINNPTAEFLADEILPDAEEVALFREEVDAHPELVEARLDAFYDAAAAAGLEEIRLRKGMSLTDLVLQARKLREFRAIVNLGELPDPSQLDEGKTSETARASDLLSDEDRMRVAEFVGRWTDPQSMKELRPVIDMQIRDLEGDFAEEEWKKDTAEEAMNKIQTDVYGYDTNPSDISGAEAKKNQAIIKTLHSLQNHPMRKSMQERMAQREHHVKKK